MAILPENILDISVGTATSNQDLKENTEIKRQQEYKTLSEEDQQKIASKKESDQLRLKREQFIVKNSKAAEVLPEILTGSGIALILYYYNNKEKERASTIRSCPAYVAGNPEILQYALGLIRKAKEGTEFGIIYPILKHFVAIKCEKINGKNHIILMDSLGSLGNHPNHPIATEKDAKNHAEAFVNFVADWFAKDAANTFIYINQEIRQTSGEICSIYSLKDIQKMLKTPRLAESIHTNKYIVSTAKNKGVTLYVYRTPPEYMRLAQSHDNLEHYIEQNPEDSAMPQRMTDDGTFQDLREYALTFRNRYNVRTPEVIRNRHHDEGNPNEPEFVYRNNTVVYFAKKYIHLIEKVLASNPHAQIAYCIRSRNAKYLKIGADGSVMTQIEEQFILEREKKKALEDERTELLQRQYCQKQEQIETLKWQARGILLEDDIITRDEILDFIHSKDNPWNNTFFAPSFLFSESTLMKFDFDRVSYLKSIAEELRNNKKGIEPKYTGLYLMQTKVRRSEETASANAAGFSESPPHGTKRKTTSSEDDANKTVKRHRKH